jgi:hypothetical protein
MGLRSMNFAEETRKWFTAAAVSFGLFMIMLDNTVVNVALPSIQRDPPRRARAPVAHRRARRERVARSERPRSRCCVRKAERRRRSYVTLA